VSVVRDGVEVPAEVARRYGEWTFDSDTGQLTTTTLGAGRFRTGPSERPNEIELTLPTDRPTPTAPAVTGPAIFTVEGRTLMVCTGGPGAPRPAEFFAGPGSNVTMIVLQREGSCGGCK